MPESQDLKIAVVGHTNVGKTSLMRTLTRSAHFGEVASSPGTTRVTQRAVIPVGDSNLELFDTPGLEDSTGLLKALKEEVEVGRVDWVEAIAALPSGKESGRFEQEAKALRQVLSSDILLYVIDARDTVRAKHRDELEILMRCAKPIVAVLNFVAQNTSGEDSWRETLARTNIHAIAPFDTVAYDVLDEIALYDKARALRDDRAALLQQRIMDIRAARQSLLDAGTGAITAMIDEIAQLRFTYAMGNMAEGERQSQALKKAALDIEANCSKTLLRLFRFEEGDYVPEALSIKEGTWRDDPFDPNVLARVGFNLGTAAATGAAVGLGIDALVGGMTFGAAAVTGAVIGSGLDAVRRYGGTMTERIRGVEVLKIEPTSFALISSRQIALMQALWRRGHGAQGQVETHKTQETANKLLPLLTKALAGSNSAQDQEALRRLIASFFEKDALG